MTGRIGYYLASAALFDLDEASAGITKQPLKMIQAYRKGSTDVTQLQAAIKVLAGAGMLFRNPDTGYDHRFKDYYWLNGDHLENIDGDYREIERIEKYKIVSYGNTYVKVNPSECDNIDFKVL